MVVMDLEHLSWVFILLRILQCKQHLQLIITGITQLNSVNHPISTRQIIWRFTRDTSVMETTDTSSSIMDARCTRKFKGMPYNSTMSNVGVQGCGKNLLKLSSQMLRSQTSCNFRCSLSYLYNINTSFKQFDFIYILCKNKNLFS